MTRPGCTLKPIEPVLPDDAEYPAPFKVSRRGKTACVGRIRRVQR